MKKQLVKPIKDNEKEVILYGEADPKN